MISNKKNIAFIDEDIQSNILVLKSFKEEINSGKLKIKTYNNPKDFFLELSSNDYKANIVFINIDKNLDGGKENLDKIQRLDPKIKVYFISSNEDESVRFLAESIGAEGFFRKPINFKAIKSIINSYFVA